MIRKFLFSAALTVLANGAAAQHAHQSGGVTQTGQSQFAAIAEIVAELRKDPATDWASVDITALRDHLVDMDNVTLRAQPSQTHDGLTVTFVVTGEGATGPSLQRMVLAHSPMLQQATGWSVTANAVSGGAKMVVTAASQDDVARITALGFFGLMTLGAHHQRHHLMIAKGQAAH